MEENKTGQRDFRDICEFLRVATCFSLLSRRTEQTPDSFYVQWKESSNSLQLTQMTRSVHSLNYSILLKKMVLFLTRNARSPIARHLLRSRETMRPSPTLLSFSRGTSMSAASMFLKLRMVNRVPSCFYVSINIKENLLNT